MRIRLLLGIVALGILLPPVAYPADRPNVLFLICDDLNCDLGSYGHPQVQSPNIDRLAARGVRFDNAHCQYPLCGPSRASFMAGMYPDQTLIRRNAIYLREHLPDTKTLSQMFRDHGYFATRIGKIYHYNVPKNIGTSGHDDPFSWNYTINPRGRDVDDEDLIFSLRPGSFGGTLSWLAADGTDEEQTDGIAATDAIRLLKKHATKKDPFFMAVGLFRPHTPFVAPKKYFDLYPLDKIKLPAVPDAHLDALPAPARRSITRKKDQLNLAPELARKAIQAYYASITFADAQLGRILAALDETGLSKNTIVLFTSDHGYHMGEHGHWQKTTLFENATHVPLIIAGPGIKARGATTTPAEMVDFYPTLAELCGLKPPAYLSGRSLVPALRNPKAQVRESAFTQYDSGYSIKTLRYRYSEWGEDGEAGAELYDHQTDPNELKNLATDPRQKQRVQQLSRHLRQRIATARKKPAGVTQIQFENRRRVR
ncbi:MAG: iduronate-2-sulfatase [Roseibacillus sp.]|nr:iduronate-2-sulfatase [Roseibacillus sp.]|tara:strand:- start:579 stop:2027 length:1449 start_codon:yes stop_codon:yes gene_type:complete